MKFRPTILTALLALGLLAPLPTASAEGWDIDPQSGKFPLSFSVEGGGIHLSTPFATAPCGAVTGSGHYATATTGKIQLTLHGCQIGSGMFCTSPGQPRGTVTTPELEFHNVYLEPAKAKAGILITPKEKLFAEPLCNGFTLRMHGTGLISEMTIPKCNESSKTATHLFEASSPGNQKWRQIETAGATYDLSWEFFGTLAFVGTTKFTFAEQATMTTC